MTQVEFENQLRELRSQKAHVMNQFSLMQNEVKEEIAAKNRQICELSQQVQKLKVQRAGITERRLKAEKDWGASFKFAPILVAERSNCLAIVLSFLSNKKSS